MKTILLDIILIVFLSAGSALSQTIPVHDPLLDHLAGKWVLNEFIFKISENAAFHTTFLFDKNSDSWQWNMDSRENGKIEPFARVQLTRAN